MWGKNNQVEEVKCSEVKSPDVYIELMPRQKIGYLMEEYKSQEWLAYMVGKKSDHSNYFVEDIVVPPHASAYGASAEAEPFHVPPDCIGIIHSHHTMGAFHSAVDQAYVDRNYPVSITVAMNGGNLTYDAVSHQKTPCGKAITIKSEVKYVAAPPMFDREEWLKEAKENIDKGKKICVQQHRGTVVKRPTPVRKKVTMRDIRNFGQYVTDRFGRVLGRAEIEDILANSQWEDYEG